MKIAVSVLIAFPAILSAQRATDAGFKPISLQEAVAQAQSSAPMAVAALGTIQNAEGTVSTAYNQFLPTLTGSLGHTQGAGQRLDPTTGRLVNAVSQPQYSTGLSTSLTLFDGGKRVNDLRARRADLASAEVSDVATKFSVALQVKQQYFAILAARESESAARLALDLANPAKAAATARVRAGAAIISDSLRSFVAVGNAQLAVLTAQSNVRNASLALTRLVESPGPGSAPAEATATIMYSPLHNAAA